MSDDNRRNRGFAHTPDDADHDPGDRTRFEDCADLAWCVPNEPPHVPLPCGERRAASIAAILDKGVVKRPGLAEVLTFTVRMLRVRNLFFGVWDCVVLGLVVTAGLWATVIVNAASAWNAPAQEAGAGTSVSAMQQAFVYISVFLLSPFMYGLLHALIAWKENLAHTRELQRACRWSFRRLTAVRMLVLGAICVVMSSASAVIVAQATHNGLPMLTILGVSFSSLFIYALLQIAVDVWWPWGFSGAVLPLLWVALCGLMLTQGAHVGIWLGRLPPALALLIAVAVAAGYLAAIRRYCSVPDILVARTFAARRRA